MAIYQGDIQFKEVSEMPKKCKEKDNIVAYGEATGHTHKVVGMATVLIDKAGNQYINSSGCQVIHQEHDMVELPVGIWSVRRQREMDLVEGTKLVMD